MLQLRTFTGPDLASVSWAARRELGDDVMVAHSRVIRENGASRVEVAATTADEVTRFRALLAPDKPRLMPPGIRSPKSARAFVVALVGPTGAGKTTTLAKLAVNPEAFGGRKVGFLTLDTFRAGAVEQLEAFAAAAGLPCESIYDPTEIADALRRLASCDVLLVDTPGRGPRSTGGDDGTWRQALALLRPDEVHLCIPATWRLELAAAARENFASLGVTHGLVTKLDEVPADATIARLTAAVDLPARWITDGQDIPADLRDAAARVLGALSIAPAQVAIA